MVTSVGPQRKQTKTSLKRHSQKRIELDMKYTSRLQYLCFSALCTNTNMQRRATVPRGCPSWKHLNFSVRRQGQIISSQPIPHRVQWDSALVTPATKEMEEKVALACVCWCPAFTYQAEITAGTKGAAGCSRPAARWTLRPAFCAFYRPGGNEPSFNWDTRVLSGREEIAEYLKWIAKPACHWTEQIGWTQTEADCKLKHVAVMSSPVRHEVNDLQLNSAGWLIFDLAEQMWSKFQK